MSSGQFDLGTREGEKDEEGEGMGICFQRPVNRDDCIRGVCV